MKTSEKLLLKGYRVTIREVQESFRGRNKHFFGATGDTWKPSENSEPDSFGPKVFAIIVIFYGH